VTLRLLLNTLPGGFYAGDVLDDGAPTGATQLSTYRSAGGVDIPSSPTLTAAGARASAVRAKGNTTLADALVLAIAAAEGSGGGDAALVTYTPAVPGDWAPVPADVAAALDQLAVGGTATQLTRVDCSVNSARVEQPYSATPFLHCQNGGNAAGGFNGGGVGNKSILGFDVGDGEALGVWTGVEWTWLDLAAATPGIGVYANLIVDQNGNGTLYKVFVIDPASGVALNNGTTVTNGDGSKTTTFDPSTEYVLVVNDIVGVVPAVDLGGPFWGNRSYRVSDILATYPLAKFKYAASADGGLPKTPTKTPAYLLMTGDSTNNRVRAFRLSGVKFDGVPV